MKFTEKGSLMRFGRILIVAAVVALVAVPAALALRFTDESYNPPEGTVGVPYYFEFHGAGGCGPDPATGAQGLPYQYRLLNGALPSGLSLSKDGKVTGTPTAAGKSTFWVELSDEDPPSAPWCTTVGKAQREFTINIVQGVTIANASAPGGTVGTPYSLALTATGTSNPAWSLTAGTLPPGLALAGSAITGTPRQKGDFTFTIKVADGARSSSKQFVISVRDPLVIVAPKVLPRAEVGQAKPFEVKFGYTGGSGANTWKLEGTLPDGLEFDAQNLVIKGTPTKAGTFPLKLTVTDSEGRSQTIDVPLTIAGKLTVGTKRLPVAKVGKPFEATLEALEGTGIGPIKWKVTEGKFPIGLHLTPWEGTISGTPRQAGVYELTFEATDAKGVTAEMTLKITVKAKAKIKAK